MKSASILSAADKATQIPDCEPGETVTITGTLGEPDASGNYPIAVESVTENEMEPMEAMPKRKMAMRKMLQGEPEENASPPSRRKRLMKAAVLES